MLKIEDLKVALDADAGLVRAVDAVFVEPVFNC